MEDNLNIISVGGPGGTGEAGGQEGTSPQGLQSIKAPIPDPALDYQLCRYIDADTTGPDFKIKVSSKQSNKEVTFEFGDSTHKNLMRILAGWGIHRPVNEISDQLDFLKLKMSPGATYDPNVTFHSSLGFDTYQGKPIFKYSKAWITGTNTTSPISTYIGGQQLAERGLLENYKRDLQELVAPQPALYTVLVAATGGLLSQALNTQDSNILLNLMGQSSIGKSTAERLALSFFGNYNDLMTTYNTTKCFLEEQLASRFIIPVVIDDILAGHTGSSTKVISKEMNDLIFRLSTGLTKGKHQSAPQRYYSSVIASSEVSLVDKLLSLEANGQFYRLIELQVEKGDLTKDLDHAFKLEEFMEESYGLGATAFGRYILSQGYLGEGQGATGTQAHQIHQAHQTLASLYAQELRRLQTHPKLAGISRAANRLAILTLTSKLLSDCFDLGIDQTAYEDYLISIITRMFNKVNTRSDSYQTFINTVSTYPELFTGSKDTYNSQMHLGVKCTNAYGNTEVIIPTQTLKQLVFGVDPMQVIGQTSSTLTSQKARQPINGEMLSIIRHWRENGWLDCIEGKKQNYRKMTLGTQDDQAKHKQQLVYVVIIKDQQPRQPQEPQQQGVVS